MLVIFLFLSFFLVNSLKNTWKFFKILYRPATPGTAEVCSRIPENDWKIPGPLLQQPWNLFRDPWKPFNSVWNPFKDPSISTTKTEALFFSINPSISQAFPSLAKELIITERVPRISWAFQKTWKFISFCPDPPQVPGLLHL